MNVACPTCGRTTRIDAEIGDFPTRCQRCSGLLRRPAHSNVPSRRPRGLPLRHTSAAAAPRGQLAAILGARPRSDELPPPVLHAGAALPVIQQPLAGSGGSGPHDELRQRRRRRAALRRAMLRGEMQALGALGWLGLAAALSLALCVLVLQVHNVWKHPRPLRADTLQADVP